jgi:deoxyribonucleoside regulator
LVDDRLLLRAASLYYRANLTQQEVASRLGVSRVKVSRLLSEAMQRGIVQVEITHPLARVTDLEYEVQRRFSLADVTVATTPDFDAPALGLDSTARAAAEYLADLEPAPQILGISWGRTMSAVARHMRAGWGAGVAVVQLNGSVSLSQHMTSGDQIAERMASTAGGKAHRLAGPAIAERAETCDALNGDRTVAATLELGRAADVAIFSLGAICEDSVLVESGYLDPQEIAALRGAGAVGDVMSRFITTDGRLADPALDARTFGIELSALHRKRRSIGVAAGLEKTAITRAAVVGGYVNALVVDEAIAEALLSEPSAQEQEVSHVV